MALTLATADVLGGQAVSFWTLDIPSLERTYRVSSDVYHHDLARSFDGIGWWGREPYAMRTNSLGFWSCPDLVDT